MRVLCPPRQSGGGQLGAQAFGGPADGQIHSTDGNQGQAG